MRTIITPVLAAIVMAVGALICASGALTYFSRWTSLSPALSTVTVVLAACVLTLLAGTVLLAFHKTRRGAFLTGGAAAVLIGATLSWGVLSGVIPCSGPS